MLYWEILLWNRLLKNEVETRVEKQDKTSEVKMRQAQAPRPTGNLNSDISFQIRIFSSKKRNTFSKTRQELDYD